MVIIQYNLIMLSVMPAIIIVFYGNMQIHGNDIKINGSQWTCARNNSRVSCQKGPIHHAYAW